MKTKEELNALKEEVETLNKKLAELTDEELAQVSGGRGLVCDKPDLMLRGDEIGLSHHAQPSLSEHPAL